jgi:hypothetical protein
MSSRLPRFRRSLTPMLGLATFTLLWLPGATHAQSMAPQNNAAMQDRQGPPNDDITRRDLARFDQFLDNHRDIAQQLRRTPSLVDDPQYLQSHPELNAYLQDHPSVKQEISERPDAFMRLEDLYARDSSLRDRDAGGQGRDGFRAYDGQDRDDSRGRGDVRAEVANFDQFLDGHREIAEQVRRDPSLCDNRDFVRNHPALDSYLRDNPEVRDQLRQDPNAFMQQADLYARNSSLRDDRYNGDPDRNDPHVNIAKFDRFLDDHREIAEQLRRNPSLCDDRGFVQNHPALQAYLQDNPDVREQLRQDPNAFMREDNNNAALADRDGMRDHRMADFSGFLGAHSDIQRDLSRDPSMVKDPRYMQQHAELNAYLSEHPDVRQGLMANPQDFVQGAQQYNNGAVTGSGAGVNSRGSGGVTGSGTSTTGTSTSTTTTTGTTTTGTSTTHPKPNQ